MQRNQRSNCQHPLDHWKSKKVTEKHLLLFYWLHQSLWLCGSQQTVGNSERWDYQTTCPAPWEICMQVKKQQLEPDMEQRTGSRLGKKYIKAILSLCLFNFYAEYIMRNTRLDEVQARIKTARRNISNLRYADDITLMAKSREEVKILLLKVKEESEKTGLKLNN